MLRTKRHYCVKKVVKKITHSVVTLMMLAIAVTRFKPFYIKHPPFLVVCSWLVALMRLLPLLLPFHRFFHRSRPVSTPCLSCNGLTHYRDITHRTAHIRTKILTWVCLHDKTVVISLLQAFSKSIFVQLCTNWLNFSWHTSSPGRCAVIVEFPVGV